MANYIDIEVSGKLPSAGGAAHGIVCCNSDYRLRFKFSAEWNAYADKTVLLSDGDALYSVTLADSAAECGLPRISRPGTFELGVIAGDGPALATVGLPLTVIPSICTRAEGALAADGNGSSGCAFRHSTRQRSRRQRGKSQGERRICRGKGGNGGKLRQQRRRSGTDRRRRAVCRSRKRRTACIAVSRCAPHGIYWQ